MSNSKPQIVVTADTSQARAEMEKLKETGQKLGSKLEESGKQAQKPWEELPNKLKGSSDKVETEARKITQAIERATAAAQAGERGTSAYFEALAKQRGVSVDAIKPYIDQLKQAEAAQAAATQSLGSMGISAKQTAAALRGVPAQFTDIVTALQGGQQPLTVFLQQGGQLKDMFGGAGAAAKALGGYVVGLINPFTVLAAGAGALAYGYYQGSKEAQEFQKSLILTGNAAGQTTPQLMAVAASVAAISGSTQSRAAEVLLQISAAAKGGEQNLHRFTAAAIEMERAGGPAAEATAKAFADLAKAPLEASIKLNETQNYLTKSTYAQIKALEDQGKSTEAARAAQEAYASSLEQRTPAMVQNLGWVERAWRGVGDGAKYAIDKIFDVGRPTDILAEQIKALEGRIRQNNEDAARGGQTANEAAEKGNAILTARLRLLQQGAAWEKLSAGYQAEIAEKNRAAIAWSKESDKYLSKQAQMEREIVAAKNLGIAAGIEQVEIEKRISAIREKYTDKSTANPFAADQEAAKEWSKFYLQFSDNVAEAEGKVAKLTKTQTDLVKFLQSSAYQNMGEPARQLALEQAYAAISSEQLAEAQKELAKISADAGKEYDRWLDSLKKGGEQAEQQAQKLRDEQEAQQYVVDGYVSLSQAIEMVTINRLKEKQVESMGNEDAVAAIQKEIDKRQELIGLIGNKDAREAAKKAADKAAEDWKKAAEKIEDSITDSLMRGFESGKGFAENLRDTVENMFKTLILRPTVSAIVQPVAQQITGSLGLASSASSASGLFGTIGSSAGLFVDSGATAEAYIASQAASTVGSSAIMSSLSAAAPYLAAAAAIYSIAKSLDNSGTPHTGASSDYSAAAGLTTGAGLYGVGSKLGDYSTQTEALTTGLVKSVVGILDSTATAFGQQAGYSAAAAFADDSSKDGAWGSLAIKLGDQLVESFGQDGNGRWPGMSFADGQAGSEQYLAAVSADVRSALDQIGLPDWASSMLDALGDAPSLDELASVVSTINATQSALVSLGDVMPQFASLTDAATKSLLDSFGGIDGLSSAAQGFYSNFYTEAERTQKSTELVTAALADLGYAMPTTRDQFREWVNEQLALGDAGAQTAAELLKLQSSVAALVPFAADAASAVDSVSSSMADMIEAGKKALASLAEDQGSLMVDLLNAQGKTAEAQALARQQALDKITSGLTDADAAAAIAAYDYNQSLRDQIAALEAATQAQADAAAAADEAIAAAKARAEATANEAYSLTTRLLTAQGDTASLRERELAALDPSNRAILEQIYALEDQKAANEAAAQAAAEAAQAAEQIRSAWQSVTDSLADEVKRIRGLITADAGTSYAQVAAQFSIATGQARAGDQEAAKLLPSLSQTMLTLAEAQATSLVELQRIRASTAASLSSTSSILAAQYGLTIPKLATGTNYVPQDMLAVIHKGEAVEPAAYNPAAGGRGSDNAELLTEIRGLREENKVQALALVRLQNEMNKRFKDWDSNGLPNARVETA